MTRNEMVKALDGPLWDYLMSVALATESFDPEDPVVVRAKPRYAKACTDIDNIVREYVNSNDWEG
jgi:hypothetical protein